MIDAIEHDRLAQLLPLMGQAQLLKLAAQLADGLAGLPAVPLSRRSMTLHRLQGGAASLGLAGLAAALRAAEETGGDVSLLATRASTVVPALAAALHNLTSQR